MSLQSEDMGKLVAGKSVLRVIAKPSSWFMGEVGDLVTYLEGPDSRGDILITPNGQWYPPQYLTLIGTLTPDGWIEGEWAENPVGDLVIEVLTRGQSEQGITVKDPRRAGSFLWGMRSDGRLKDTDIIAFRPAHREAQPETDGGGEIEAIRQSVLDLCKGHPHAKIAWPHRELHVIADRLAALASKGV